MPIDRWMDKEDVVHIYNGILLSHKKERNWVICRDVNASRDCHTEWSKSERAKQILYINAYMWNLEKWYRWTGLQGRNWDTDVENKHMDTKGGKRWRVVVVVVWWIGRLGLTCIHWCVWNGWLIRTYCIKKNKKKKWAKLEQRTERGLKSREHSIVIRAVKSWKKDLSSCLLWRKNSAKRPRLWQKYKCLLETKWVWKDTQVDSEWVMHHRGSIGCLYRGSFPGCLWPVICIFGTGVQAHLSAKMDSSWHLLPPFVLPLDWGPSLHMCQAGKSTGMHPVRA